LKSARVIRGHPAVREGDFSSRPDFFGHQEWADAVHWRAFESHPGELDDEDLRRRLDDIQAVQRAFLTTSTGS
jgi:hypothetical protein